MGCVQSSPPLHAATAVATADQASAPSSTHAPADNPNQNSAALTASGRALALPSAAASADHSNGMCTHVCSVCAHTALLPSLPQFTVSSDMCVPLLFRTCALSPPVCHVCRFDTDLDAGDWCVAVAACTDCTPRLPLCDAHATVHGLKRAHRGHRVVALSLAGRDAEAKVHGVSRQRGRQI